MPDIDPRFIRQAEEDLPQMGFVCDCLNGHGTVCYAHVHIVPLYAQRLQEAFGAGRKYGSECSICAEIESSKQEHWAEYALHLDEVSAKDCGCAAHQTLSHAVEVERKRVVEECAEFVKEFTIIPSETTRNFGISVADAILAHFAGKE